ncbi:MAG: DUF655 domain-containing protein [Thermoplasmata archaeon]|nr:DUF655 domain-containing protein [Thermoplasmata archaeon]RLF69855.1 MAG: DUF655 domain-containing protein [Thermoplasmata archaeon]RLF74015.1 MAG: DUF655 domain-containing protein [Thermoplasmata archaeon]RLF75965.1 MAG: DUF655 domain-containing protein [Thermoplasmata archaeon]HDD59339.1 DUF655 domain-containing protein [Euryarchaeota archaeon]
MEEFAYVLDYLPQGLPDMKKFHREPVVYAIGESEFKILEIAPLEDADFTIGERIYVGKEKEKRDKVRAVKRRVSYDELTHAAKEELPYILEEIVRRGEEKFVEFFNTAQPITTRLHSLELLPGLGKKTMWAILEERKKSPFASFSDLCERVPTLRHPERLIVKRIIQELENTKEKYRLFVR